MMCHGRRFALWVGIAGALVLSAPRAADALYQTDRIIFRPSISVQGAFHHDGFRTFDAVQERNEFKGELKYRLVLPERPFGALSLLDFNMLYRARYDAIFDIRESYRDRGYDRDDFRFPEGKIPRELYFDVGFNGFLRPLSLRLGRQQVVWGEADLFRSIDVVNPLRLDQQGLIGDELDAYREPLWIAKGLLDLGRWGPTSGINLEFFYSPNWRPLTDRIVVGEGFRLKLDHERPDDPTHLRRNFSPFQRVRHPWEVSRVGGFATEASDGADTTPDGCVGPPYKCMTADFVYLIDDDQVPKSTFDLDASMFGVRLLGHTYGGLDFTVNYLFKRTEVPGTSLPAHLIFDPNGNPDVPSLGNTRTDVLIAAATVPEDELRFRCLNGDPRDLDLNPNDGPLSSTTGNVAILDTLRGYDGSLPGSYPGATGTGVTGRGFTGCLTVPFWYPWTHIVGATLTYNDYDFTGMIWRLEQSYSTKEPRNGVAALAGPRQGNFPQERDFATSNKRSTGVWRSMVGFDYLRAFPTLMPSAFRPHKYLRTWFNDQWFFTAQFLNEYYPHSRAQIGLLDSWTDRMHSFNPVFSFVMTGFFLNNLFRPFIAAAYDVNDEHPILWAQGTYFLTPQLSLRVGEILYMGSRFSESFLFLHKYADRDTTFVRLTYYLL